MSLSNGILYKNGKERGNTPKKKMVTEAVETSRKKKILDEVKKSEKKKNIKIFFIAIALGLVGLAINAGIGSMFNHFRLAGIATIIYAVGGVLTSIVAGFIADVILSNDSIAKANGASAKAYDKYVDGQHKLGIAFVIVGILLEIVLGIAIYSIIQSGAKFTEVEGIIIALAVLAIAPSSFAITGLAMYVRRSEKEGLFVCEKCDTIGAPYDVLKTSNHKSGTYTESQLVGYKPSSENTLAYLKDDKGNEYRIYEKEHGHFVYNDVEFQWNSCDQLCKCRNCGHIKMKHLSWRRPM